jgi:hypothetical protein
MKRQREKIEAELGIARAARRYLRQLDQTKEARQALVNAVTRGDALRADAGPSEQTQPEDGAKAGSS